MRRFFALLLVTPLLASCSDAVTPVAPSGPVRTLDVSPLGESSLSPGWTESALDNWTPDAWTLAASQLAESPLQSAPGTGAVMLFGNPLAGTDYPPGSHDQSFHGVDRIIPDAVVMDVGQTVTFQLYPGHRVAIYKPGVRPEDLVVPPGAFFVLDPTHRLALQAFPAPAISFTFAVPGRYLVICAISRHFLQSNMYGWIIVR